MLAREPASARDSDHNLSLTTQLVFETHHLIYRWLGAWECSSPQIFSPAALKRSSMAKADAHHASLFMSEACCTAHVWVPHFVHDSSPQCCTFTCQFFRVSVRVTQNLLMCTAERKLDEFRIFTKKDVAARTRHREVHLPRTDWFISFTTCSHPTFSTFIPSG